MHDGAASGAAPSGDAVVAGLVRAINRHDAKQFAAFFADEFEGTDVALAQPVRGSVGVEKAVAAYLGAFPDAEMTVLDLVVRADAAALVWTARGTHQGALMHIPPTGKTARVRGMTFLRLARGKVVSGSTVWDVAGLLRELGLLPELQP